MHTVLELRSDLEPDRISDLITIDTDAPELRFADKVALRVGLALLLWGRRRPPLADPREHLRMRRERAAAEQRHDDLVARAHLGW